MTRFFPAHRNAFPLRVRGREKTDKRAALSQMEDAIWDGDINGKKVKINRKEIGNGIREMKEKES